MKTSLWKSSSAVRAFLILYAAALLLLLPHLSLWLDEIIDLKAIRDDNLRQLITFVPTNAGGVPLSYLIRQAAVHLLGCSAFSGRLPSAMFSVLSCAGVLVLAKRFRLKAPLLALVFFCLCPLQLRYALESRPYSQALAISIWATVALLHLIERFTVTGSVVYGLSVAAGLYTQPFSIFVPLSHVVWTCCLKRERSIRSILSVTIPVLLAGLLFLPWYFWAASLWRQSVITSGLQYHLGPKAPLLIFRELTGAGYLGTVLILGLAWAGLKLANQAFGGRSLLMLSVLLPIGGAVLADFAFGYFLAIRQMIFALCPLSLLASYGAEELYRRHRGVATTACALLAAVFLLGDVHFFTKPRENWKTASDALQQVVARSGCILFAPSDSASLYAFFIPQLRHDACTNEMRRSIVALAISPYDVRASLRISQKLLKNGYVKCAEFNRQGPMVDLYKTAGTASTTPGGVCR